MVGPASAPSVASSVVPQNKRDKRTTDNERQESALIKITGPCSTYIHYEFDVPQGDRTIKTDIVGHPASGKVFLDSEARPAQFGVQNDGNTWVGWTHYYPLAVDWALIDDLYDHGLEIRLWDTKDKVSSRARFDKPKHMAPPARAVGGDAGNSGATEGNRHGQNRIETISSADALHNMPLIPMDVGGATIAEKVTLGISSTGRRLRAVENEKGTAIEVGLHRFFVGDTTVVKEFSTPSELKGLSKVQKIRVTVSLDRPLLSPENRLRLNPTEIRVEQVHNLPEKPVSYVDLSRFCHPVSVVVPFLGHRSESFFSTETERSETQTISQSMIVLLGKYDPGTMASFLARREGLSIEVHDRARKSHVVPSIELYGEDSFDDKFNSFACAIDGSVEENALTESDTPRDPYGVAKLDLSDLVNGQTRVIHQHCQILPGPRIGLMKKTVAGRDAGNPMHPGLYVEYGSYVSIKVKMTHAFSGEVRRRILDFHRFGEMSMGGMQETCATESHTIAKSSTQRPAFIRAAFVCSRVEHTHFSTDIQNFVESTNFSSLGLDQQSAENTSVILDSYELTPDQIACSSLDVITGFQVTFPDEYIIVIEGLNDGAIQKYWTGMVRPTSGAFKSLFNSQVREKERLYGTFGPKLCNIFIPQKLPEILRRTELYVKDAEGWGCLGGLVNLNEIVESKRIDLLSRLCLFPTADALIAIDTVYGVSRIASAADQIKLENASCDLLPEHTQERRKQPRSDNRNPGFIDTLRQRAAETCKPDFLRENIASVRQTSRAFGHKEQYRLKPEDDEIFMYSQQRKNHTVMARTELQRQLRRTARTSMADESKIFTYEGAGRFHHSGAFALTDPQIQAMEAELKSNNQRIGPKFDSTAKMVVDISRDHLNTRPDPPVIGMMLEHGNSQRMVTHSHLQPLANVVVGCHKPLPWDQRDREFKGFDKSSLSKPGPDIGTSGPISIHLHGASREAELKRATDDDHATWASKLVTGDTKLKVHRTTMETKNRVDQLDKNRSLLKDPVVKTGFKLPQSFQPKHMDDT